MYLKFYLPILYAFKTRMGYSIPGAAKWICEYIIPTFSCYILASKGLRMEDIGIYILMILLIYTIYEVGYIQNDAEVIKKEQNPTLRLDANSLNYYEKHKAMIWGTRLLTAIFISGIIIKYCNHSQGSIIAVSSSWSILLTYFLYNSFRGKISFILHFLLLALRYSSPLFLFWLNMPWFILALSILIYPLPIMMEVLSKGKFGLHFNFTQLYLKKYERRYHFRVKYYLFLTILFACMAILKCIPYSLCLIPAYFLIYQCLFFVMIKRAHKHKGYIPFN
jgi:hypothetical protein